MMFICEGNFDRLVNIMFVTGPDNHSSGGVVDIVLLDHRADHRQADNRVPVRDDVHIRRDDFLCAICPLRTSPEIHG